MSGGEANTPDVFREVGRTFFFGTNAFRHPLRVQMLNLGTFPGSFFSLKIKLVVYLKHSGPIHPQGCISFAYG